MTWDEAATETEVCGTSLYQYICNYDLEDHVDNIPYLLYLLGRVYLYTGIRLT